MHSDTRIHVQRLQGVRPLNAEQEGNDNFPSTLALVPGAPPGFIQHLSLKPLSNPKLVVWETL